MMSHSDLDDDYLFGGGRLMTDVALDVDVRLSIRGGHLMADLGARIVDCRCTRYGQAAHVNLPPRELTAHDMRMVAYFGTQVPTPTSANRSERHSFTSSMRCQRERQRPDADWPTARSGMAAVGVWFSARARGAAWRPRSSYCTQLRSPGAGGRRRGS
jgi:hypothetical protein